LVDAGQSGHAPAQQGLAAGQPDLLHAQPDKQPHQPRHFLVAQPVCGSFKTFEILGQAVAATQVAAVRDRDAQIVDAASVAIR
jgi:hypothetical protein